MMLRGCALSGNELVIGLLNFFKAHFGQFLKITAQMLDLVRMIFSGETAVGGFDFFPGCARRDTQDRVRVLAAWSAGIGGAIFPVIGRVPGLA